jgi:hypothetical protein
MTMRALIVLLAVLNLGVTAWWLFRPEPAPVVADAAPPAVARLQLASERPDLRPAPAPQIPAPDPAPGDNAAIEPAATETAIEPAAAERCVRLGPFADAAALDAARTALAPRALRLRPREEREGGGRGWRVYLPAAADRATADATAERLRGAGFSDLLVVANGAEANSIALGRFSSETRAQAHAAALQAAGFAARAEALGEVRTTRWLDLALAADTDPAALQRSVAAARSSRIDCAGLR